MSDLGILFPEPETIYVNGAPVIVRHVRLADFELFGDIASDLLKVLSDGTVPAILQFGKTGSVKLRKILRRTTNLSRWRVWRLPVDVAMQIVMQVIRVNAAFFARAQQAAVTTLATLVGQQQ
ncbi:hypothetical protein [Pseudomonas aeruginosa]|uniref:hypothetical protein n=1 Tax=Pseudomonas aeruginosa TaxID=287 RepID=UPI0003BB2266|nr:hypothetical protein [Pseudomonas aeruginosa]ERY85912.1 hypothetical protein Q023_05055 [Pseudomonas aeruginosa BWHPSA010]